MKGIKIGTPYSANATKVMLLGSGELGKELAIELMRFGVEVIAVDRYERAPAMQVAHRSHTISMLDGQALRQLVEEEKPNLIVPEIEAIATDELVALESEGYTVIPTAKATQLTMNREGIRTLAAETLSLPTSDYRFADDYESYKDAVQTIGLPCIIKPIMSSSGKGQSKVSTDSDIDAAWDYAQVGGRAGEGRVIIESVIDFDYEITLLTVRHAGGTAYCEPIGHRQEGGDYRESWQPQAMSEHALEKAKAIALSITDALGGYGLFGVELFIKGDDVFFSEVSPRPHDTGMVTLISQNLSEFALHARAILGLPIPSIEQYGPSASAVIMGEGHGTNIQYTGLETALDSEHTGLRLFGKPEIAGTRRMGVALAKRGSIDEAVTSAKECADSIGICIG